MIVASKTNSIIHIYIRVCVSESDYLFKLKCGKFFIKSLSFSLYALAHGLLLCKRITFCSIEMCITYTMGKLYSNCDMTHESCDKSRRIKSSYCITMNGTHTNQPTNQHKTHTHTYALVSEDYFVFSSNCVHKRPCDLCQMIKTKVKS